MSIDIQKQIKDNSQQVSEYFKDIVNWSTDEKKKETRREAKKAGVKPNTVKPPEASEDRWLKGVRVSAKEETNEKDKGEDPIARDQLPMPQYYHNWDQFDAEKEVDALDEKEEAKQHIERMDRDAKKDKILDEMAWNGQGDRVRTSKARPRVKVCVRAKGRMIAPIDLAQPKKAEANKLFAEGRFKEAMIAYSTALDYLEKYEPPGSVPKEEVVDEPGINQPAPVPEDGAGQETEALALKVTLLANRSQALIRLEEWREAIWDCDEALRFDPMHHKATLRRGFALAKQKRWSAAARDLETAVANDPQDKKAAAELQMARRNLAEQAKEVRAHAKTIICDTTREPSMPTRKLTVKVRRAGDTFEETSNAAAAPAASSSGASATVFQPQPRGARGENSRLAVDLEDDSPPSAPAVTSGGGASTGSGGGGSARQPYVPRSVRIRGRQPAPETASAAAQPSPTAPSRAADAAPAMNFYSFEAQWMRNRRNPRERAALLRRIGAAALPALFRESLDAELVGSIISVLSSEVTGECEGAIPFASSVMASLSRTQRFQVSLECLSPEEMIVCQEVLLALERQPADCVEDLLALRASFEPAPLIPRLPDESDGEDEDDVPQSSYSATFAPDAQASAEPLVFDEGSIPESVVAEAVFSLDGCD